MPSLKVDYTSQLNANETYLKVKEFFNKSGEMSKFDPKIECKFNDQSLTCDLKGSQFKGDFKVSAQGNGSLIVINIDLPFILTPFKSKVQEGLFKMLKKHLG